MKAARETAGDVLRQIALYKTHHKASRWVLASLYELTKYEHEALSAAGIVCIRIGGEKFRAFVEQSKVTKATGIVEL